MVRLFISLGSALNYSVTALAPSTPIELYLYNNNNMNNYINRILIFNYYISFIYIVLERNIKAF